MGKKTHQDCRGKFLFFFPEYQQGDLTLGTFNEKPVICETMHEWQLHFDFSISCVHLCVFVCVCFSLCRHLCVCVCVLCVQSGAKEASSWTPVTASLTGSSRALHYSRCASEGKRNNAWEPDAHNLSIQSAVQTVSHYCKSFPFQLSQVQQRVKKPPIKNRWKNIFPFCFATELQKPKWSSPG